MSFSPKRFTAPALTALAVAAVPLVAPMTADAALGGAKPLTSTTKPSLRSATVISPSNNQNNNSSIARICFDKPVSIGNQSEFSVGIYRVDPGMAPATANYKLQATGTVNSSPNCIDASFATPSLNPYTYITAGIGSVFNAGNANVDDSTTLVGATTQNGTTGRTTAPDLTGLNRVVSGNSARVRFEFDQNVAANRAARNPGGFRLVQPDGTETNGVVSAVDPNAQNVVNVDFATQALVISAVRGYTAPDTLDALDGNDPNTLISLPLPGSGGSTTRPDLQTVSVTPDGRSVDFRYDENIQSAQNGSFFVTLSDGQRISVAPFNTILNGDTVRATIPNGDQQNEYIVNAYALEHAVERSQNRIGGNANDNSTAGGLDAGDNRGAFAQGFTTAPEALSVTFNAAAGTASILLDQRANASLNGQFGGFLLGQFRLLDAAGNEIATNASSVSGASSTTAQRVTAVVSFPPADVAKAAAIQLLPNAFTTFISAGNPVQVLAP